MPRLNNTNARAPRLWMALALMLLTAHAAGAATQTFVSAAKGDDANTCEQDKPCRTFAGALLKTDAGGELAVLDAGEYGPFKVHHSVKVTAAGVYAGVTAVSGDAVHLAPPSGSTVALRGLTITGRGGERGVNYLEPGPSREPVDETAGVTLHVEDCTVSGFSGSGIAFHGQGALFVKDTTARGNGYEGLSLRPPAAGVRIRATVVNSRFEKNWAGLVAYSQSEVDVAVTARDTVAAGNKEGGFTSTGSGVRMQLQSCVAANQPYGVTAAGQGSLTLEGCLISNHKVGMWVVGGGRLYLSGTTVANNEVGLDNFQAIPGHVYTFGDNRVFNNGVNAQGKPSLIAPQF